MTVQRWRFVVIACDVEGCDAEFEGDAWQQGEVGGALTTLPDMRREAEAQGWRRENGKDVCWKHEGQEVTLR